MGIEDGVIREIGAPGRFDAAAAAEGVRRIDASDRLVIPGRVNAHSHGHGALGRGAVKDLALEGFLVAPPAINGRGGVADLALSTTLKAVELLKKGCTAVFDVSGEFPLPTLAGLHAASAAYDATGIRAVVAPMMANPTLFDVYPTLLDSLPAELNRQVATPRGAPMQTMLDTVRAAALDWPFDRHRVRLGLAPTIPLHCSDDFLRGCAALSAEFDLPMQTQLAESSVQAQVGAAHYGRSLMAHLGQLGLLSPRLSVAHVIWVSDADIDLLAAAGLTAVHNPGSNLRLGSGIAPVRRINERGLRVALGADGANTSDTQNLFEGLPLRDALRQLVHGENGAAVDRVLVGGRLVVDGGRVTTVDEAELRRQAQAAAERLDELNAAGRPLAQALRPWVSAFAARRAWHGKHHERRQP